MAVEVGTILKGRYEILRRIGRGAIATVWLGLDQGTKEIVAIKVIENVEDTEGEFIMRFRREAKLLNDLRDPHIVRIYDFGSEENRIFIVMEYLEGKTIAELIREKGAFGVKEALQVIKEVTEGLRATVAQGVVHRDIKPQNLMITADGGVKIMDFGIAKSVGGMKLSSTGFLGTPYYISPEQAEGQQLDVRSDIYSAGVVLFEMLTGRVIFDGDSPLQIAMKHLNAPVPPLHLYRQDMAPQVEALVNKCLAKKPGDRFQTPDQLLKAIEVVLRAEPFEKPLKERREELPAEYEAALVTTDGRIFPIRAPMARVGRTDPRSQVFPDIDLSSEDPKRYVSRRHARIFRRGRQWFIVEEVGVKGGTFVNRRRLSAGEEAPLQQGDTIRFARTTLTFQIKES